MQCLTELIGPSAVTHALSLPFVSKAANNLVVVKTSLLQIFAFKSVTCTYHDLAPGPGALTNGVNGDTEGPPESARSRTEKLQSTKLVLVGEFPLSGTVTSLGRVKLLRTKTGADALLIALRDAKLSLVEWDPDRCSISTISIHYYEREDLHGCPWDPPLSQCRSQLAVDPRSRCAALKFGKKSIAILPFHQGGDDLAMDDLDGEGDAEDKGRNGEKSPQNLATPYAASFVLSLLAIDPQLTQPIDLTFLFEFREPTFGILYSHGKTSNALLHERRDIASFALFTLDLEQRASTALITVDKLPYDLWAVKPLRLPIGGVLLLGVNEVIHVDESGKTIGIAVNEAAKASTSFSLQDYSSFSLRLENCVVEQLGWQSNEVAIFTDEGRFAILKFIIDGRQISGLSLRTVSLGPERSVTPAQPTCAAIVGRGRMFIGSHSSHALILGWSKSSVKASRRRSQVEMDMNTDLEGSGLDDPDLDEEEDDLYSTEKVEAPLETAKALKVNGDSSSDEQFRTHDRLRNFGILKNITLEEGAGSGSGDEVGHQFVASSGHGTNGCLTSFQREVHLEVSKVLDFERVSDVWTWQSESPEISSDEDRKEQTMIINRENEGASLTTHILRIAQDGILEDKGTEFESESGPSIEIGLLNSGSRIAQVLATEVRTYEKDFGLSQIVPLYEEDSEPGAPVVSASILDPFVLLVKSDSTLVLLQSEESGDLEEIENKGTSSEIRCASASLYEDTNDVFRLPFDEDSDIEATNVLAFLLTPHGGLNIYRLPDLSKSVYAVDGLSFIPPFLAPDFALRRNAAREDIIDLLIADVGDTTHKSPYMILRSASNDMVIYQPYQATVEISQTTLRFAKVANSHLPKPPPETTAEYYSQELQSRPLRALVDFDGNSTVFAPGPSSSLIAKSATSVPKVFDVSGEGIRSLSMLSNMDDDSNLIYADYEGVLRTARSPKNASYETGFVARTLQVGRTVDAFDYLAKAKGYVIATKQAVDFKLAKDNTWGSEDTEFLPQIDRGCISLLDQRTSSIIDEHVLDVGEIILCLKTLTLETSEFTPTPRSLVAVGTALLRCDDSHLLGRIYVFDVIPVVPDPENPTVTDRALKLISREEVKGAVTSLSAIGTQGFLLVTQGQKVMARGLKEDGSLMPLAFMDMQIHTTVVKSLGETCLWAAGDAVKGLWFCGYTEDPYHFRLFGKSKHMEVMALEFLPDGQQLYIVVADAECNLHILQYDPEHPKSLSGHLLLHHSSIHTGSFPTNLHLLPRTSTRPAPILLTTTSGSISLLTPLSPIEHRTLSALQSHLQSTLPHHLGLNPKAYRAVNERVGVDVAMGMGLGGGGGGGRQIVDGNVLKRWMEGGRWKRWEGGMQGGGEEGLRGLLREVQGGGLPF